MGIIANKIRQAIYGVDVREDIAQGIEAVEALREEFDIQVINSGNSNAEIVAARGGETSLDNRLDKIVETKASVSYVNAKIQANNLAYKESYATLALLQTAYPTGDSYNHTVLADGMIYTYVNSAWVSTQIQANGTAIPDNSVGFDKTTFITIDNVNLFDKASFNPGGYYHPVTFKFVASSIKSSNFIPCVTNDIITIKQTMDANYIIVYKNSNGIVFAGEYREFVTNNESFIVPSDAISFSVAFDPADVDGLMIFKNMDMSGSLNPEIKVTELNIPDKSLSKSKVDFETIEDYLINTEGHVNIFDKTKVTIGCYDPTTLLWMPSTVLQISEWLQAKAGDIIRIKPGQTSIHYRIFCKDINDVIFSGMSFSTTAGITESYTIPTNTARFTVSCIVGEEDTFMVTKNTPMPDTYVAFNPIDITFTDNLKNGIISLIGKNGLAGKNDLTGKYISILGDSISTFVGYVPDGNAVYYFGNNTGVSSVNQTWWKRTIDQLELNLCINNSWGGSKVTTTNGEHLAGCMARSNLLHLEDKDPDIIIVYLGINDFNTNVELGSYDGTQDFPTVTTTFREAYAIMLDKILTRYKSAMVYVCTLPYCERTGARVFPEKNGDGVLMSTWNNAIRDLADLFNVEVMEFAKSGLTYQNQDITLGDWNTSTKTGLHFNSYGHKFLGNKAIKTLDGGGSLSIL